MAARRDLAFTTRTRCPALSLSPSSVICWRSGIHRNGDWQRVRQRVGGALERRQSSDDVRRHAAAGVDCRIGCGGGRPGLGVASTPAPGGGTSADWRSRSRIRRLGVQSLSPASVTVGASPFTVTVNGSGLVSVCRALERRCACDDVRQRQPVAGSDFVGWPRPARRRCPWTPAPVAPVRGPAIPIANPVPGAVAVAVERHGRRGGVHHDRDRQRVRQRVGVRWNGAARATTFVSGNSLQAVIPVGGLRLAGASVWTPAQWRHVRDLPFTIANQCLACCRCRRRASRRGGVHHDGNRQRVRQRVGRPLERRRPDDNLRQ